MKAIEIHTKTDKNGRLKLNYPVNRKDKEVRVIILLEEQRDETEEEKSWYEAISSNPVFDFLQEPSENIYSLKDGEPFND